MRSEIQSLRGLTEDTSEKQQRMVQDLDEKLQNTQKRSNEFELKQSEALSTLDSLRDGIDALFQDLGCQFGSSAEILGDNTVTESNMMQYLGTTFHRLVLLLFLSKDHWLFFIMDFLASSIAFWEWNSSC